MAALTLWDRAGDHGNSMAIMSGGRSFSYSDLLMASASVAAKLLNGRDSLDETRVAFLVHPSFEYVATQWGIWRAGGIAVPLAVTHPEPELAHVIDDSGAALIVADAELAARIDSLAKQRSIPVIHTSDAIDQPHEQIVTAQVASRAMILYTSGTTGIPKGVVTTHEALRSQVTTLVTAWEWDSSDRTLLTLPLHHVHGIVNVLSCALWVGAQCKMLPRFSADRVWDSILQDDLSVFMAVPTIYVKLIDAWERSTSDRQSKMSESCRRTRLMVSGSAALSTDVLERWRQITGHVLLERYGMTEIGMALSNPLKGRRIPGHVGVPLPNIELRLVNESGGVVEPGDSGEIQVKGPGVFKEYWQQPEVTAAAFSDGWFATGDIAVDDGNDGYRILGRNNVDIIKTGGFKISALEIEGVLGTHPAILSCAVVGLPDAQWGERVCVAAELTDHSDLTLERLRSWAKDRLAAYKIPADFLPVAELPRNAMGKVIKSEVANMFETKD